MGKNYHGIEVETWILMGDPHATPTQSNDRFRIAGNFINDRRPTKFGCVGDWGDFASLSAYDKGKKSHEGMRYSQDVLSVIDAQELLFGAIKKSVRSQLISFLLGGNHDEGRINKALNNDAQRDEISIKDCLYDDYWTYYSSYNEPFSLNDIWFNHHFNKGNLGKAIAMENLGKGLVEMNGRSSFMGHSHLRRLYSRTNVAGVRELAGDIGCYLDYTVDYMPPEPQANWARGLLVLTVQGNDILGHEWVDMVTLKRDYN